MHPLPLSQHLACRCGGRGCYGGGDVGGNGEVGGDWCELLLGQRDLINDFTQRQCQRSAFTSPLPPRPSTPSIDRRTQELHLSLSKGTLSQRLLHRGLLARGLLGRYPRANRVHVLNVR